MHHYVARSRPGTVLFRTWEEGVRLFNAISQAFPELLGLCVMPDHIHLQLPHAKGHRRLGAVMSGYTRWRNARREQRGMVAWNPAPVPEFVEEEKESRNVRYVHLNPCRKGIVGDPLSWPLSTHRDAVGMAARPITARDVAPARFHEYVSSDPTVNVAGTPLPEVHYEKVDLLAIRDAVSATTRTVVGAPLGAEGTRLFVQTATAHDVLAQAGSEAVAAFVGISRQWVNHLARDVPSRGQRMPDPALAACVRAVGDPRFTPLFPGDLLRQPGWEFYRNRR